MIKPTKYIFLSSSSKGKSFDYYELESDLFFVGSWAGTIARRLKNFNNELDISIWRMESLVKKPFKKEIFGLQGIIWPKKWVLFKNVFTLPMYLRVLRLSFKYNMIIHYHSLFSTLILLKFILPGSVKVIFSHHGGVAPIKGSLKDIFFRLTYRKVSAITYISINARDYLKKINIPEQKIHFLPVGADFNIFKPSDKILAREKLNLNKNMIYGIYVGAFYSLKSVDLILKIYHELKSKYNFSVIFVGGEDNDNNNLFRKVSESGCPFYGRQKWTDLPDFYNAADFYIHPVFHSQFGGLDVSWIEALACNKPVLSPQLKYLDFDYSELGVAVETPEDVNEKVIFLINNSSKFRRCREISVQHLDANYAIMKKLTSIYSSIIYEGLKKNA